jgi:tRNA threonylcarbamoyl adenosine modification protein YeaZ
VSTLVAIDTATDLGTVAVGRAGHVLHEVTIPTRSHAARTLPTLADLLWRTGLQWSDLSGLVIADGPGSFTGLRIGLATAKGILAAQPHVQLLTAPSLLGAAWAARPAADSTVGAVYDALRGEVFVAVYRFARRRAELVVTPRLVRASDLRELPVPDAVTGDGAAAHGEHVAAWAGAAATRTRGTASAGALLELLAVDGGPRPLGDVAGFEPAYGRRAAAEDRWEATHGRRLPDS